MPILTEMKVRSDQERERQGHVFSFGWLHRRPQGDDELLDSHAEKASEEGELRFVPEFDFRSGDGKGGEHHRSE